MPSGGPTIANRRYRAPQGTGEVFCDPPDHDQPRLVAVNRSRIQRSPLRLFGKPHPQVASEARAEFIDRAIEYTREYADVPTLPKRGPANQPSLILAGHQPQLFHPGVWYKNFVLDRIARNVDGVAVNVIIDNDAAGPAAIRVPSGTIQNPGVETIHYDRTAEEALPFEEQTLSDRSLFHSFSERVVGHVGAFVPQPLIIDWWPRATKWIQNESNLGRCISRARHEQEIEWGVRTLELPLSVALETQTFQEFVAVIVGDLPQFRDVYNRMLVEYRRVNRIRSRSHPAPELQSVEDWLEAPFWIWSESDPRRQRLFVRRLPGRFELTDRDRVHVTITNPGDAGGSTLPDQFAALRRRGVKIRPRALMTTMFLRLFLGDLFIHGIGGGKYDQLTDGIVREYFGVEPPEFVVVTATLRLPIARPTAAPEALRAVEHELRDLVFNPDRHVEFTETTRTHVESKRNWLAAIPSSGSRKPRHQAIAAANDALRPFVAAKQRQLEDERARLETLLRHERILGSREYAFCLYPAAALQALLLDKS